MIGIEFIFRIIGMILFSVLGVFGGLQLSNMTGASQELYAVILGLLGALIGLVLTPFITTRPARYLVSILSKISVQNLAASLLGLVMGLLVAALLAFPLSLLPKPFSQILPFLGVILFGYIGVVVFVMRQKEILSLFSSKSQSRSDTANESTEAGGKLSGQEAGRTILLDTSVIIDGRIADIARTGFLVGTLLIPRFVLNELQYIADSADALRRQRGRRGMEVLSQLQKDTMTPVRISDIDVEGVREVDDKLVVLARQLRCPILTNDYNLNRVADLQGVIVLNVNELANAVKSVFLPGEVISVNIIQEGREAGQGIAYLDDGTMVVVEDGRERLNKDTKVTVTKVLQTAAGRMIFARIDV
ncbi:MAG TPA: PIN domain-containing protein [Anaerolineales bacterium]|nr:PIN domain-containing protein [Anaerolineales bacterium]